MTQAPALEALLAEYAAECAIDGLGVPDAQIETYQRMEAAGILHLLGAFINGDLVGFVSLLVSELPHYGRRVATTESLFVAKCARKSGAGLKLLKTSEQLAASLGAVGLLISAPYGGRLAKVLPRIGFQETNRVFFRSL